MTLVLDSALPLPLLATVLDTVFERFQTPMVSLLSSPTVAAVAAGVRSALVVNMGWSETVVTSIYEYQEVKTTRSVRAGRSLLDDLYKKLLYGLVTGESWKEDDGSYTERVISFEEVEDIMCRLMWCRPTAFRNSQRDSAQLETVEEQDETEAAAAAQDDDSKGTTEVPLTSTIPPKTICVSFEKLADVCDDTFFNQSTPTAAFDDHELPIHTLVYQHLLQLPIDVRAICMSRIILTGGCSNILGLKQRLLDELTSIVERRQWEPISGKAVEAYRSNPNLKRNGGKATSESGDDQTNPPASTTTMREHEPDPVEAKVRRHNGKVQQMQGQLRALHTLGPWTGASLVCQMKIASMATIDRDLWLQQGIHGASRPGEIDIKAQQRQSMGAGGLIRGSGGQHTNWTLGAWGTM
jgi:actin-related protein